MTQCKAKSKHTGNQCRAQAIRGREVCRVHGGMTPRGTGSPHTKTGRYSKDLPTRLLADYEAALADPDLIAVRDELAVCKARGAELLRAINEAGQNGRQVATFWAEFFELLDHTRSLAETERKRLEAGHRALTEDRVLLLVTALVDAVRRHVDDRMVLDAISRDIGRLVDNGSEGTRNRDSGRD